MDGEDKFLALIDFIYEAALDDELWPTMVAKLADVTGAMQTVAAALDQDASKCEPITASAGENLGLGENLAVQNPLGPQTATRPADVIFPLENAAPGKGFLSIPAFVGWWRLAQSGSQNADAIPPGDNKNSSLIRVVNGCGKDFVTDAETRTFKTVLRHLDRAVRIHNRLKSSELPVDAAPGRFDDLGLAERNLRRAYGLTNSEARLAIEIVKGDGRKAAAARRGVSESTVRTHLSNIFAKTGIHRQAQLIRLVLAAGKGMEDGK